MDQSCSSYFCIRTSQPWFLLVWGGRTSCSVSVAIVVLSVGPESAPCRRMSCSAQNHFSSWPHLQEIQTSIHEILWLPWVNCLLWVNSLHSTRWTRTSTESTHCHLMLSSSRSDPWRWADSSVSPRSASASLTPCWFLFPEQVLELLGHQWMFSPQGWRTWTKTWWKQLLKVSSAASPRSSSTTWLRWRRRWQTGAAPSLTSAARWSSPTVERWPSPRHTPCKVKHSTARVLDRVTVQLVRLKLVCSSLPSLLQFHYKKSCVCSWIIFYQSLKSNLLFAFGFKP